MALLLKNKNLFHKLAPLWAVLVTALYFAAAGTLIFTVQALKPHIILIPM